MGNGSDGGGRVTRWRRVGLALGTALGTALALVPASPALAQAAPVSRDDLTVGRTQAPPPPRLSVTDDIERGPCPLAAPAFADKTVDFAAVDFEGLPGIPASDLDPTWRDYAGRELPIATLCDVRDRAATILRNRGFLAAVQIPPQRIEKGGTVRMDVLAAKLVELQVRGDPGASEAIIADHLEPLTKEPWFNTDAAQRNLLLLRDLPGTDARLTLRSAQRNPGEVIGDILVTRTPVELVVGGQNLGSKATGREGLFAELALNGLLGLGDRTTASIYNTVDWSEQTIARASEELALGARGLRAGASILWGRSEPGLAGGGFVTNTIAGEGHLRAALQRTQARTLFATGGLELVDQKLRFGTTRLSRDQLSIVYARLDYLEIDPGSLAGANGFTVIEPEFRGAASFEVRKGIGAFGASHDCSVVATCLPPNIPISNVLADPQALVARFSGQFEYRPAPHFTLAVSPLLQWANHPLLAYEQASFGNYTIGRGLDPGLVLADDAAAVSLEARLGSRFAKAAGGFAFEPFVFLDFARAWIDDDGLNPDPRDVLTSGAGVRGRWGDKIDFGLTFAAPLQRAGYQAKRSDPRLLFTISARLLPWGDR